MTSRVIFQSIVSPLFPFILLPDLPLAGQMDDNFPLNRLMFCMAHGNELCNKCYCDHRMCNNIIAESMEGSSGAAKRLIKDAVSVYFFPSTLPFTRTSHLGSKTY